MLFRSGTMDIRKINWYPGHMKKTGEMIKDNLKLVDVVVEVIDARIPESGRNPTVKKLIGDKPEIIVLNKVDLAEPAETLRWNEKFGKENLKSVNFNGITGKGTEELYSALEDIKTSILKNGMSRSLRIMVVGVPNTGKSRVRHDPCIGVRGSIVATAMARLVTADMMLLNLSANLANLKKIYAGMSK